MKRNKDDIIILPDLHIPFTDWNLLEQVHDIWIEAGKPLIVQLGDIMDQKAWSRFPKHPGDKSPQKEWNLILKDMERLHKLFPEMIILQGNHDVRLLHRQLDAMLPKQLIKSLDEIFNYEGWHWYINKRPLVIDGITFLHGDELQGQIHLKLSRFGSNIVYGHTHQAGIQYLNIYGKQMWALETGCIVDVDSPAFGYAAKYPKKVVCGFGAIIDGIPHFYPLERK